MGPAFAVDTASGPFADHRPISASTRQSGRRPQSGRSTGSTALSLRPTSAPGKRQKSNGDMNAWWMTPDDQVLQTPRAMIEVRRPAAEELQQELTLTATVLRTAQNRLAEERESRLRARASEELAMVDLRQAKEEARAVKESQRDSDRQLAKALMAQRKELEGQLEQKDAEAELQMAHMQAERQRAAEKMRQMHEDHALDLADKLKEVTKQRDRMLGEQREAHKKEAEKLAKMAADQALLVQKSANEKLEDEREKRVAHLGQIGVKRMMNQKLSMGWSAWREMYLELQRKKNLLKAAGARLTKPALVHAFGHWQKDWQSTERKRASQSLEEQLAEERALRQAVELELAQVPLA